jgi:hypothetical protein
MKRFILNVLSILLTFIVLFMLTAFALAWFVPAVGKWHMAHCLDSRSLVCFASSNISNVLVVGITALFICWHLAADETAR